MQSLYSSIEHGQTEEWAVTAWSENGDVSDVHIKLSTSTSGLTPEYSFGCGSYDGTQSCDLGSVFSGSIARQVIASMAIPASDKAVTSVELTATESATDLSTNPAASVSLAVGSGTAGSSSSGASPSDPATGTGTDGSTVSQLPVGSLPAIGGNGSTSSISPGGNAAGLFPTINSSQDPSSGQEPGESARQAADSEALPIGTPVIDAQLLGLGALAVAFLLAVTRLSVRRRPAAAMAGGRGAAGAASIAPTRAEAVAPAAASTTDDDTREDLASGDSGDAKAAGSAAETRDDIKPIRAPWELGNKE